MLEPIDAIRLSLNNPKDCETLTELVDAAEQIQSNLEEAAKIRLRQIDRIKVAPRFDFSHIDIRRKHKGVQRRENTDTTNGRLRRMPV